MFIMSLCVFIMTVDSVPYKIIVNLSKETKNLKKKSLFPEAMREH